MVTLKFYTISERRPKHKQLVLYFRRVECMGHVDFSLREETAYYCWFELDEDGDFNGSQILYTEGEEAPPNCKLEVMFGHDTVDDQNYWWCPVDEYDDAFPD